MLFKTPSSLLLFLLAIAAAHFGGVIYGWYFTVWWFDIPMHLAGGAWVGVLFLYLFGERFPAAFDIKKNAVATALFLLGFTALVGIGWEVYEYIFDAFVLRAYPLLGRAQASVADTVADLVNDLIGGGTTLTVWLYGRPRR